MDNIKKYFILPLLIAIGGVLFLPVNTSLKASITQEDININLPCWQATVNKSEEFSINTEFTGYGLGIMAFSWDEDEVRLKQFGLYRGLNCTVNIYLPKGKTVRLPKSMPFAAKGGIMPIPSQQDSKWRSFKALL